MSTSPQSEAPKAFIKTYGCQMNEQDSAQMQSLLSGEGFARAEGPYDADLILINTCAIREKAVHKIYSDLGRLRPLKVDRPDLVVGIAGCVAEQEKKNLSDRFPFLDLVFGPDHIRKLPQMIADVRAKRQASGSGALIETGFDLRKDFQFVNVMPDADESPVKAFVNIQKGCDNVCSFCIVPFVRGREVSRPYGDIVREIRELTERGVKEVTLLGQNVNSYGLKTEGGKTFAELLELIAGETDLKRLRFTTSHPKDVGADLVRQYRDNPILAPHFHLPVQSGSDEILKLMKRQYTRERYLGMVADLQDAAPDIRFSTDVIVGFPNETDAEFEATLSLMSEVRYDLVFSFVYSPRPYTKAAKLDDNVPYSVKLERLKVLQDLTRGISKERNVEEVGSVREVLVETADEDGAVPVGNSAVIKDGEARRHSGRTPQNKIVHFEGGNLKPGDFADVTITRANAFSLLGELCI